MAQYVLDEPRSGIGCQEVKRPLPVQRAVRLAEPAIPPFDGAQRLTVQYRDASAWREAVRLVARK